MRTGKKVSLQVSEGCKEGQMRNGYPAAELRGFVVLGEEFQLFSLGRERCLEPEVSTWKPILLLSNQEAGPGDE